MKGNKTKFHRKHTKVADKSAGNCNISNASLDEGIYKVTLGKSPWRIVAMVHDQRVKVGQTATMRKKSKRKNIPG
jgi:hypothetical protein